MTKLFLTALLILTAGYSAVPAKFTASFDSLRQTAPSASFKTDDAEIAGKWILKVQAPGQQMDVSLDLTQEEKTFQGTMSSVMGDGKIVNGKLNEKEFTCFIQANIQGQDMEIQMTGKIDGDKMSGSLFVPNMDAIPFEGAKSK